MRRVWDRLTLLLTAGAVAGVSWMLIHLLGFWALCLFWIVALSSDVDWVVRFVRRRRRDKTAALRRLHRVLRRVRDRAAPPPAREQ
ncbi:hypothetical protein [Rugamonas sp.]|uniref:hypothetical protein n=1 Tax=Rugamonas sp. TaxID=1926287 RepID=UPI0025FF0683|nr:hypothetical protein [Rugamonas sp.]